ncbi:MAG: twin-arginine translocase TatA/TatE family subunit, partial [Clostridia bacterium]
MFNISFAELIVILLLAFLILGPDEMVKVARFFGKLVRKGRKLLWRIRDYVNDEASDAGLD